MGTSPRGLCCWVQDIGYKFKCQTKNARVTINDNLAMFSLVKVILNLVLRPFNIIPLISSRVYRVYRRKPKDLHGKPPDVRKQNLAF